MASSMVCTPLVLFAFLALDGTARLLTLLAIGFAVIAFDPAAMAAVQESATHNRALASSVYLSLSFFIRSVAVVAVGVLADWIGLRWAFAISAIIFLLGTPLVLLLPTGHPQAFTD
jgi:FSR family fosmidomycin resistance protein-like MFS transporter